MSETIVGTGFNPAVLSGESRPESGHASGDLDLFMTVYEKLGLIDDKEVAAEFITGELVGLRTSQPEGQEIEPFIAIALTEQFGLVALKRAYDNMPAKDGSRPPGTYVHGNLWNNDPALERELNGYNQNAYDLIALNSRSVRKSVAPLKVPTARGMLLGTKNTRDELGLHLTGLDYETQQKYVKTQEKTFEKTGQQNLLLLNTADYVIINALRREKGEKLLDKYTFTRFVQMAITSVDGMRLVVRADSDGMRLSLRGSGGYASSNEGVRLSVGPKPESL